MSKILSKRQDAKVRKAAGRIAADYDGTPIKRVEGSTMYGEGKTVFGTQLPSGTRIEVGTSNLTSFPLPTTIVGVILPEGFDPEDEDTFHSFDPSDEGLFGLRYAYRKLTGNDIQPASD